MNTEKHYIHILKKKLEERIGVNPNYSLRAFSRDLGLSPSNLSEVLNGKKALTEKSALKISMKLGFSEFEKESFCTLVNALDAKSKFKKKMAQIKLANQENQSTMRIIQDDSFKIISDWYHFAILELLLLKGFQSDYKWIAEKLGITELQSEMAIERLLRMELISQKNGEYISTGVDLSTSYGLLSESIRKFNLQVIEKAKDAISVQNVDERYVSTLTLAISKANYRELTKMLEDFKNNFNSSINSKYSQVKPDEVYCFSMQFFKLTKG